MKCPYCKKEKDDDKEPRYKVDKVINKDNCIIRYRKCSKCDTNIKTIEIIHDRFKNDILNLIDGYLSQYMRVL